MPTFRYASWPADHPAEICNRYPIRSDRVSGSLDTAANKNAHAAGGRAWTAWPSPPAPESTSQPLQAYSSRVLAFTETEAPGRGLRGPEVIRDLSPFSLSLTGPIDSGGAATTMPCIIGMYLSIRASALLTSNVCMYVCMYVSSYLPGLEIKFESQLRSSSPKPNSQSSQSGIFQRYGSYGHESIGMR